MAVILHVSSTAIHGGAEEALLDIMGAAVEIGHRPVLVTPGEGWLTQEARAAGISTALVPSIPEAMLTDSALRQFVPTLPAAMAIARLAREQGAALIHSNTPRTSYQGGLGARIAGIRAMTHCYDIIGTPYRSAIKARFLHGLADWTLAISNATAEAIVTSAPNFRGRVSTLYYGFRSEPPVPPTADASRSARRQLFPDLPADALLIGCAAAMTPWKGQDVLVEAFGRIAPTEPRARLVIVGASQGSARQDRFEEQLHALVEASGLASRVIFTGWRADWRDLVAALDIFVHAPTEPDPLPLVVLHACRLGRPVVGTTVGGIPEIIGEGGEAGLLVPSRDPGALAGELSMLLRDPARRSLLGAAARRRMERFSWAAMKTSLEAAYGRVLGS